MPKKAAQPSGEALTGRVKSWGLDKGFGFIVPDGGGPDVFVHHKEVVAEEGDRRELVAGQRVSFVTKRDRGRVQAAEVRVLGGDAGGGAAPPPQQQQRQRQQQRRQRNTPSGGLFASHLGRQELQRGLKTGALVQGSVRLAGSFGFVAVQGIRRDILLDGAVAQNRCFDGDVVAIRINAVEQWKAAGSEADAPAPEPSPAADAPSPATPRAPPEPEPQPQPEPEPQPQPEPEPEPGISKATVAARILGRVEKENAHAQKASEESQERARQKAASGAAIGSVPALQRGRGAKIEAAVAQVNRLMALNPGRQPTAQVVAIIDDSARQQQFMGTVSIMDSDKGKKGKLPKAVWFKPYSKKCPRFLMIPTEQLPDPQAFVSDPSSASDTIFSASVVGWDENSRNPRGRLNQFRGVQGDIESETAALLLEWRVDERPFSDAVMRCLPETPWSVPQAELDKRRDLRSYRICSIDPPTARDLDDALHCKRNEDGTYEVGVHIADVSHFVVPDTALDEEASARSTSVYLVQKVIPMLPRLLCEQLCSLNPGEDRLAFSVIWQLNADGTIISTWFGRTVIRTCFKLHCKLCGHL